MTTTEQKLREALSKALVALSVSTPEQTGFLPVSKADTQQHSDAIHAAREALALPPTPVQMPEAMTYEQIKAEFQRKQDELSEKGASANCPEDLADFTIGVRFAEAHHFGITAQAKKETP